MEVHCAASSSPQILSLFPQTTMEAEEKMDPQASGLYGNRSGYGEYDLESPTGAFLMHPPDQQVCPRVFQVEPPEQEVYPNVFKVDAADQQVYPSPLAEHEALLANPTYFYSLFNNFHASLGTRLTVPNIGGTELDLHVLYRQVTACGGLEQVIKERRWKEIATALKLPKSIINPSFVLRKHYIDLLYHFEQVHYFGAQGQLSPPPGPLPAPHPSGDSIDNKIQYYPPVNQDQSRRKKKKKADSSEMYGVNPGASIGHIVTGAIDRKFDNGYLVTVVVGSEKLKGVIYHVPTENTVPQHAIVPGLMSNVGCELDAQGLEVQMTEKKKESVRKRDPNAPRRPRNGYNLFYVEQLARLKEIYGQTDRQIKTMVIDMWNRLSDDEKLPYVERGRQDTKRYKIEMKTYTEKMKYQASSEGYNGDNGPDVADQQIEGNGMASYFNDASYDYHVSLEAEADTTSFHEHQQQGFSSGVVGVQVTGHESYSGEDGNVYSVPFPQPQISESGLGNSSHLQQTYDVSGDQCVYQTQSNASQSGIVPCSVTSDQ
ncbi:hypothetical protein KI387_037319, partial [Taxus chinensis]